MNAYTRSVGSETVALPLARTGRVLGLLLLVHLVGGLILPYVLLNTALASPDVVMGRAAAQAATLRAAVVLFIAAAALVLAIAAIAWPVFRTRSERLALAFVALGVANLPLQLVESGTVLTMLSLAERFGTGGSEAALLQAVGAAAAFARRWAHFTHLLTVVGWLCLLYLNLWRTALVPRLIAGAGVITTLLQITGVSARTLLGYGPIMELALPLAPVHASLVLWLIVKGFRTQTAP